ncbi:MAG TPA: GTP-binding protein [Lachnospiraceae bacterium]|nr:GTP-binding protein [Lachnospiraceae bacterium]
MTKIDIFSGFLGAGKTTLIKKLLKEVLSDTKVVLIENEFGEIGIDGGFLEESGIEIKEMNSGCICCSLVGDFGTSLREVINTYAPERILIEPSGVGKLSDVIKAVENVAADILVEVNSAVAVVDASKCKMYIKNFGEFFCNQIAYADTIILSRTANMSQDKLKLCVDMIREYNKEATIITTPWEELMGADILKTIEGADKLEHMMEELLEEEHHHHHDHEEDDEEEECSCEHHHHHDHEEDDEEEECSCGHHHHHDHEEHDENCTCGCHDHEHDHHADEVFTSWGKETPIVYTKEDIERILTALDDGSYGMILRAKGMVPLKDGTWIYFDYVPEEKDIRIGKPQVTGKLCVIGSKLAEDKLETLFFK